MKKILKRYMQEHSLLTELLVAILMIFALSISILGAFSIRTMKKEKQELYLSNLESSSSLLMTTTRRQLSEMSENAYLFSIDSTLKNLKQSYKLNRNATPEAYIALHNYVNAQLGQMENLQDNLLAGALYLYDGQVFHTYNHMLNNELEISEALNSMNARKFNSYSFIFPTMDNVFFISNNEKIIPVVYPLDTRDSEYLICLISIDKIENLFREHYMNFFDDMEIIEKNGTVISRSKFSINYGIEDEYPYDIRYRDRSFLLLSSEFDEFEWTIHIAKDTSAFNARIRYVTFTIALMMLLMTILAYLSITKIYSRFRIPFDSLSDLMKKNSRSLNYEHFNYPKSNEIGKLGSLYNEMIDEIGSLVLQLEDKINQLEEEKRMKKWEQDQKRLAEIKALQAQINPHFLYNALNTIVWMAEDNNDMEVVEMTLKLADFYKTGLSKGQDLIPLKMETEHARNYLWIQSQRYDRIEYSFDIEESLYSTLVPKLILQPLIENAIYHGIKPMDGNGSIDIVIVKDRDTIVIDVMNTGLGINRDKLKLINQNLKDGLMDSSSGYGIYNVNNRIRLSYGPEWGLQIMSDEHSTTAEIRLPAKAKGAIE